MTSETLTPAADDAVSLDIMRIMELLPHRYPFLLVDRVTSCVPGKSMIAYKNVSVNEPFFQGHFPNLPVMPGVLIIEALAQAGGLMVLAGWPMEKVKQHVFLFSGIENVKFRQPVRPGDRLDMECTLLRSRLQLWKIQGRAFVDGKLAAEAELTAATAPREAF